MAAFMVALANHARAMERILRDRLQPLELYEDVDINKKYKFPCKSALYIIDQLGGTLTASN